MAGGLHEAADSAKTGFTIYTEPLYDIVPFSLVLVYSLPDDVLPLAETLVVSFNPNTLTTLETDDCSEREDTQRG
jgi:hypothetical protein